MVTLAISDVPGDDPAVIASGPTMADPTTYAEARAILERYGAAVPEALRQTAMQGPASQRFTPRKPVDASWGTKVASLPAQLYEFEAGRYSLDAPNKDGSVTPRGTNAGTPRTAAQNRARRDSARAAVVDVQLTRTDEPKLQVPFVTPRGGTPRQVLLEREKRLYKSQDLAKLLKEVGVDFSHGGDPCPAHPSLFDLPLRLARRLLHP